MTFLFQYEDDFTISILISLAAVLNLHLVFLQDCICCCIAVVNYSFVMEDSQTAHSFVMLQKRKAKKHGSLLASVMWAQIITAEQEGGSRASQRALDLVQNSCVSSLFSSSFKFRQKKKQEGEREGERESEV